MNTPRAIDPNFAQSLADGLTESYEAYRNRLSETPASQPIADPPDEEAT